MRFTEEELSEIQVVIDNGANTIKDIYQQISLSIGYQRFYFLFSKEDRLRLPKHFFGRSSRIRGKIFDETIGQGEYITLEEISKRECSITGRKVSRNAIEQWIKSRGLYEKVEEARQKKLRNKEKNKILEKKEKNNLEQRLIELWDRVAEMDEPIQLAVFYRLKHFKLNSKKNLNDYTRLFNYRQKLIEEGRKEDVFKIGEETGFSGAQVARIFKELNLEPFFWFKKLYKRIPWSIKEDVFYRCETNDSTIAYFLGTSQTNLWLSFRKIGKRKKYPKWIKRFSDKNILTYQKASQLYETLDYNQENGNVWSKQDMCEIANVGEKGFDYAVQNREQIGKEIVGILRVLYPEKEYTTPYKK